MGVWSLRGAGWVWLSTEEEVGNVGMSELVAIVVSPGSPILDDGDNISAMMCPSL